MVDYKHEGHPKFASESGTLLGHGQASALY